MAINAVSVRLTKRPEQYFPLPVVLLVTLH